MTTTPYDQPVARQFINTYAPVNIDRLFQVTAQQQERLDRERKEIAAQIKEFSEFQSLSSKDMKQAHALTLGRSDIANAINEFAANPDALKDNAKRSQFMNSLNTIAYDQLNRLKQNAKQYEIFQKNKDALAQAGRLGPDWWLSDDAGKPLDVSNWDTLGGDGTFTHTALTPYQSLEELSSPYYKDLKPGYLDSVYEGGIKYDLIGNNEADLNQIASTNAGIIKSTEAGAKHYQYLLNQTNGDVAKADQLFNQAVVESQRAKTLRPNKVADTTHTQMSIANLKAQAKMAAANGKDLSTFTTMVANDSLKRALRFGGATSEDLAKLEDGTLTEQEQEKMLNGVRKTVDHTLTVGLLSGLGLPGAYNQLAKQYDSPISSDASDILMKVGPANTPISDKVAIFTDTNGLTLKNDALATMSTFSDGKGVSASARVSARLAATSKSKILKTKANADAKFSLDFYGGKFTEVLVMGLPSIQSTLVGTMHNRVGYIPTEQLTARGYSLEDIALLGRVVQGDKLAKKITKTVSGDIIDEEAKTDKQRIATSISGKDRKYLEVKLVSKIPTEISSEIKSTLDAGYNTRVRKIGSKLNFAQAAHSEEE